MTESFLHHCEATRRRGGLCSRRATVALCTVPGPGITDYGPYRLCTFHAMGPVGLRDAALPFIRVVGDARVVVRITEALA